MQKLHGVNLSQEERVKLTLMVKKGIERAQVITRARVLLLANAGKTDKAIARALMLSTKTPFLIRKRRSQGGLQKALFDRPRPGQPRRFNGAQEAEIVAIACTKAPKGYAHWTLDLLTDKARSRGIMIGRTAVWKVLLRNHLKPWRKKTWCINEITPEFRNWMFDILEVYERPYDPTRPVVCIDEKSKQLLNEIKQPVAKNRERRQKLIMSTSATVHVIFLSRLNLRAKSGESVLPEEEQGKTGRFLSGI